jgi:hypothetical protein
MGMLADELISTVSLEGVFLLIRLHGNRARGEQLLTFNAVSRGHDGGVTFLVPKLICRCRCVGNTAARMSFQLPTTS